MPGVRVPSLVPCIPSRPPHHNERNPNLTPDRSNTLTTPDQIAHLPDENYGLARQQPPATARHARLPRTSPHPVKPRQPRAVGSPRMKPCGYRDRCSVSYAFHWTETSHRRGDKSGNWLRRKDNSYLKSTGIAPHQPRLTP